MSSPHTQPPSVVRLAPGTRVTTMIGGRRRTGVVQLYEPQHTRYERTFPVRLDDTGQWRLLRADEVTVVASEPDR